MTKNIVLCCDGTGNSIEGDSTNVLRLFACLATGNDQLSYYDVGVGTRPTMHALTMTGNRISQRLDAATGMSARTQFCDAYRFLLRNYEPGDRVFLFGFSRGAYLVRLIAASVHAFGLLGQSAEHLVPLLWSLLHSDPGYEKRTLFVTFARIKKIFKTRQAGIHFVGVWDTVSALGWVFNLLRDGPYTRRNPSVGVVRHALAIDERRTLFRPVRFRELGLDSVQEVWFAGVHSDVGGGYPAIQGGLSAVSLAWMFREAESHGLLLDREAVLACLDGIGTRDQPAALGFMHNSLTHQWWSTEYLPFRQWNPSALRIAWKLPGFGRRRTIEPGALVHESVVTRMKSMAYRPSNLPPLSELQIVA